MKRIRRIVIAVLIALVATPAAQAGGWWGPHYRGTVVHVGGYGPGYGPYATPWHVRRHHYRGGYYGHPHRYRHDNRGRYAAGGILLGLALGSALSNPGPRVVERRHVLDRGIERTYGRTLTTRRAQPEPDLLPALGYRLARDGTCWLVEDAGDGRTIATEVPPEEC